MKFWLSMLLVCGLCSAVDASGWYYSNEDARVDTTAGDDSDYDSSGPAFTVNSIDSTYTGNTASATATATGGGSSYSSVGCIDLDQDAHTELYCSGVAEYCISILNDGYSDTVAISASASVDCGSTNEDAVSADGYSSFGDHELNWDFSYGSLYMDYYDGSTWYYSVDSDSGTLVGGKELHSVSYTGDDFTFGAFASENACLYTSGDNPTSLEYDCEVESDLSF